MLRHIDGKNIISDNACPWKSAHAFKGVRARPVKYEDLFHGASPRILPLARSPPPPLRICGLSKIFQRRMNVYQG